MFGILGSFLAGAGGALINKVLGMADDHLKHKRELEAAVLDRAHELKVVELDMSARMAQYDHEVDVVDRESASKARTGSYKHATSIRPSYPWVDAVRALVRPTLTLMLVVYLIVIYLTAEAMTVNALSAAIVELSFLAVGWWFGGRTTKATG